MTFPPPDASVVEACLAAYQQEYHSIRVFGDSIRTFFATHPLLNVGEIPPIHSLRFRMKDPDHLRKKIIRKKVRENRDITPENLFDEVTDLVGVRVLHLHKEQFPVIDQEIQSYAKKGAVLLAEAKAITWDPESASWFKSLGFPVDVRESHYTSVHYILRPNNTTTPRCEIQVRTLFEEAWGEVDHLLNYPETTDSVACSEQLRVLAKLVGAGSRLVDAIFRSHDEHATIGTKTTAPAR